MASGGKTIKYKKSLIGPNAPDYLKLAAEDVGLKEATSYGTSNPEVEKYVIKTIGKRMDVIETPWCAYWAGGILEFSGYPSSKSGMARSFLNWGEFVDRHDDSNWKQGDIVVLWRGRRNDGVTGHVGFLVAWDLNSVILLGGNQGDQVCFQEFPRSKILGLRRPRSISKSRTVKAVAGAVTTEVAKPVVDLVPEPALPNPVEAINKAQDSLSSVQPILDTIGTWKPYIKVVLTTLTVAFALAILYYRVQDANTKGRT